MTKKIKVGKRTALVDEDDYLFLNRFKWYLKPFKHSSYATARVYFNGRPNTITMHRLIMCLKGRNIDHINNNGLDNRKVNLRFATASQNNSNRPNLKLGGSGFRGVYLIKKTGRYCARISIKNKTINIGNFKTKEQAWIAYKNAAKKLGREFYIA